MKRLKPAVCLLSLVLTAFTLAASQPRHTVDRLERVIPREMESRGWALADQPFFATDLESLAMVINGAAPQYMELGVQRAAFVYYSKDTVNVMLEIFETASRQQARGLYSEFAAGPSRPLDDLGSEARLTAELGGTYMAEYYQDAFYIRLSIDPKSARTRELVMEWAREISKKIPPAPE